jgi:hypothetical protein
MRSAHFQVCCKFLAIVTFREAKCKSMLSYYFVHFLDTFYGILLRFYRLSSLLSSHA